MKKILFALSLISFNLFGACLEIGSNTGQSCSGSEIIINNINYDFTTNMKVSDNGLNVVEIPIYVSSDSSEEVSMTITDNIALENSANESISNTFEYIQNSSVVATISSGTPFVILAENANGRDGNTIVGYIRITVNSLSDTQTAGNYSLSKDITVKLNSSADSSVATLNSTGIVEQVSMVGFENLATYTIGKAFKDGVVDYGNFTLNSTNEEIKDIFVKNNTTGDFQIKFETSDLISQVDSNYKIGMNYFYKKTSESEQTIDNNTFFTLMSGKNNGTKVGEMRFVTESLTDSLIAGEYKAIINVTVSAN